MARLAFKKTADKYDVFRFIDGTLIGKSGRRSQMERDVFITIVKEYGKNSQQTLRGLKNKFGVPTHPHQCENEAERELCRAVIYTFNKMADAGLIFPVSKGVLQFSYDLWNDYITHKDIEVANLRKVLNN